MVKNWRLATLCDAFSVDESFEYEL